MVTHVQLSNSKSLGELNSWHGVVAAEDRRSWDRIQKSNSKSMAKLKFLDIGCTIATIALSQQRTDEVGTKIQKSNSKSMAELKFLARTIGCSNDCDVAAEEGQKSKSRTGKAWQVEISGQNDRVW
jgi:hypothetical protein